MNLTGVLYIVMAVIAVMLIIKFVIWLLPVILVVGIIIWIYNLINGRKSSSRDKSQEDVYTDENSSYASYKAEDNQEKPRKVIDVEYEEVDEDNDH